MKYWIECLIGAPLDSWTDRAYTPQEITDKFYSYAEMEWDELPPKKAFTLEFIAEMWQVRFERESANE